MGEGGGRQTVDDPALDFGRGDLQRCGDVRVRQVLPNVLEAKIGECQQADFAFELGGIQAYLIFPNPLFSDARWGARTEEGTHRMWK